MTRRPPGLSLLEVLRHFGIALRDPRSECFEPTGASQRPSGYWNVYFDGSRTYLHRLILLALVGETDSDTQARHRCGHKWCANPNHIEPGSIGDNMRDQYRDGHRVMNEARPNARLSSADARLIRDSDPEISSRELADRFGMSPSYINQIRAGTRRRFLDQAA